MNSSIGSTRFRLIIALVLVTAGCDNGGRSEADAGSADGPTVGADATTGDLGEAESRYIAAIEALTQRLDTADCNLLTARTADYGSYYPAMTNDYYRNLASTRFKPVLDYMSRKLCNTFEIMGNLEPYKRDALADSPASAFLSGTPLLQAIVDESSEVDSLLQAANSERRAKGLDPIIVADYPNSIVGGPTSTVVFIPGWPDRPHLDQWIQVQRTVHQMFFVTLEPRDDGRYNSFAHASDMTTSGGKTTVGTAVANNGTCLQCHYSGRPIHMRALDDANQAAKVASLVKYLQAYPAKTNHPDYNPFPSSPGIGTAGALTLDEAATYAGRKLTTNELDTLNRNTSCDSCHNDTYQSALRPPFDQTVDILMRNGIMPPGAGVTDATNRAEAIKVMMAAYKVRLKQYFLGH